MEATELRLGNWVYGIDCNDWEPTCFQVSSIYEDYVNVSFTDSGMERASSIKPIPLTPEWLLKSSLKRQENPDTIYRDDDIGGLYFQLTNEGMYLVDWDEEVYAYCEIGQPMKYVHQLQNLYFALAGKELEFKL